jgi:hypothetical protein
LHGLARHGGSPRRRLKPGTVLVRDYQGQRMQAQWTLQLKREWSPWPEFGWIPANLTIFQRDNLCRHF